MVELDFVADRSIPGGLPVFPMYLAADGAIFLGERGGEVRPLGRVRGTTFDDRDGAPLWRLDGDAIVELDDAGGGGRFEGDSVVVVGTHRFELADDGAVARDGAPLAARFRGLPAADRRMALCLIVHLGMVARRDQRRPAQPGIP